MDRQSDGSILTSRVKQWLMLVALIWCGIASHERSHSAPLTGSLLLNDIAGIFSCNSLSPPDSISCATVKEHVDRGDWPDPNGDRDYIRLTLDSPPFHVSLHSREYDFMRYDSIYETGRYYETEVVQRFNHILRRAPQNSLVLDVGSNIGYYSLLSVSLGHSVHAFEINPANLIRTCESLSLNQWVDNNKVTLYRRGVSNVTGQQMHVVIPKKNPGQGYLQPLGTDTAALSQTSVYSSVVTTITLDQLAHNQGWFAANESFSIPLLKMDVEGAEPLVIQGAEELLYSGIVKNVLTEFRQPQLSTEQGSLAILLGAGYRIVNDQDEEVGIVILDLNETLAFVSDIAQRFKRREYKWGYTDLWFQLDETAV